MPVKSTLTDKEIGQAYKAFESDTEGYDFDRYMANIAATKEREKIIAWSKAVGVKGYDISAIRWAEQLERLP